MSATEGERTNEREKLNYRKNAKHFSPIESSRIVFASKWEFVSGIHFIHKMRAILHLFTHFWH